MSAGERRLRILVLPSWYPHADHPTYGIFNRVQAEALARRHRVVLAPVPEPRSLIRPPRQWHDRVQHARTDAGLREIIASGPNRTPGLPGSFERTLARLYQRIHSGAARLLGGPPDLIHAHAAVPAGYFGARLAAQVRVPLVLTEHISRPELYLANERDRSWFLAATRAANHVIAVGALQREKLRDVGVEREIDLIPNLIDTDFFSPGAGSVQPPTRMVAVGHLIRRKGFHHLLTALAEQIRNGALLTLDLAGRGPEREALSLQASKLGIRSLVRFHGERSPLEVRDLLRESHLFVASSLTESFGVAVIEAMSVGLPVLVTRSGGPETFVTEAHGTVVEADSADALARGLAEVLSRLNGIDGAAQRKFVLERFSESVVVDQLTARYHALLGWSREATDS